MFPLPRKISRYVLWELATPTFLSLSLYTFVLLMNHFFVVAERSLAKNLDWNTTLRMFALGIPVQLVLSIPMATLLGCLIGVGRLSADHEWVALQTAGHGPSRLLRPVLVHGLLLTMASFFITSEVVPRSAFSIRTLRGEILLSSSLASDLKPRVFYTQIQNVVLFVRDIPAGSDGRLEGLFLVQTDPERGSTELYLADYGFLAPAQDNSGALLLDLYSGVAHFYETGDEETYRYLSHFDLIHKRLEPAAFMSVFREPPEKVASDLTSRELLAEYHEARQAWSEFHASPESGARGTRGKAIQLEQRVRRAVIELHQRLALPAACFVFALLSVPLGVSGVRSGKGAGFALSLMVIVIYWACFTFTRDQALTGKLPPALGPWVANIVILLWGLVAVWRMRRPRGERVRLVSRAASFLVRGLARLRQSLRRKAVSREASPSENGELVDLSDLGGTSNRFIGRLDQYVGLGFLRVLLFALLSCYLIYALIESKKLVDGLLRTGQPLSLLLRYFQYFGAEVLHVVLPISCLVAAVVSLTVLARTGELTAVKAAGISMRRVTASILFLTLVLCGLLSIVEDRIVPVATQKAQVIKDQILGHAPRTYGTPLTGRWSFGPEGRNLYHYQYYDADAEQFQALRVFTLASDRTGIIDHRFHETARWQGERWELGRGWYRRFGPSGEEAYERSEETTYLTLDPPENFAGRESRLRALGTLTEQMSLGELSDQIKQFQSNGYDVTRVRVAFHKKIAQAATPLVMVLLGLPFAFRVGRKGSLYGIGVALLLVLVYWGVFAVFNALGLETLLDPIVAAWAPNVFFGLLGSYLMLYIKT